ncbi:nSTAND1 domain-containing NTPase [Calothrix sp. 336/3]|uniref:WD40 domain-containing protein n=1 Tax=Calothrix sp. 336/3 TaxID=1337936 RepID=UPI0004E2F4BE|nr:hypothetical protein [Calothrix sp. 336/3]AKG23673.1 hypothetical protein IJ00_22420 [Calothrix sp. 336/3]
MKEWQFTAESATENTSSLQRLIRAIALSKGQFSLILVRCNYLRLRQQILHNLRNLTQDMYLRELVLAPNISAVHTSIVSELFLDNPAVASDSLPSSVMVFGLEAVNHLEDVLSGVNKARDIYADTFSFPIVLWLTDEVATALSRLAPDFKSWAATTIKFEMPQEDLIALIRQETESLFKKVLATDVENFLPNTALDLDPKSQQRREIEAARNDLQRLYGVTLEPELAASLEFVLGRDRYANDQITEAIAHYQTSMNIWHREVGVVRSHKEETHISNSLYLLPAAIPTSQERLGVVLFNLGLCYRRLADLQPASRIHYWQQALYWFKQCLTVLECAQRQDLVAKYILPACKMLQNLQAWQELRSLAQQALALHQTWGTKAQIAQDYGFLADVALSELNWLQAHELGNTALNITEEATDVSRQHESWYLLLIGRTQRHLGKWEEAVNNLEWARVVCELQYDPALYLEIIEELRSLYFFERHDYLEAFRLKQEKIHIEHQYGFRAFIGATQLQPQRYRINPVLKSQTITSIPEEVAQEIAVSGRQQDINRLLERITRADYKLTVVHGPSGVGKSSLLKAGLIPALKQKVIGERIPLSVFLSVYTDWLTTLGRNLNQAIVQTEVTVAQDFYPSIILEKLRALAERNYTIILIFDQFEEFFFVNKQAHERNQFYQFFSEILNIPYVKVILSLREDYLHYLLELERLCAASQADNYDLGVINKNILDKDIRYYLGNFPSKDAISIIHNLTKRSHHELKDELIHQLVKDLTVDGNTVHPIELQIVGAQLQTENITTLMEYQKCGGCEKLIQRWLEEVIKDCGRENEQLSWKLLFELTDEKGTRPLKTNTELVAALLKEANEAEKVTASLSSFTTLELVLDILVGSGLVLQVRQESGDRYQLVHDYLVEPIRQKNNYGIVAELEKVRFEKNRAEVARKLSQEQLTLVLQRRLREARAAGIVLGIMSASIGGLWWQADTQRRAAVRQTLRAERSETNLRISAVTAASEALFASNKEFDALLESLRAWRRLKQAGDVPPDTKMRVVTALQQAVYGVTEINRLEAHTDIVWGVTFSPNGQFLASGSRDRSVKIWRPDGSLLQSLKAHTDSITSLSFSPDSQTLVSASIDKTVQMWRFNPITGEFDPQPYKTLKAHGDWVYSVNFSPSGEFLATGSKDNSVKIWRRDGQLLKTITGHQGWVNWVSFSPDNKSIVSASDDKTIKIWGLDGNLLTTLSGHTEGVTVVAFSPDGKTLASAGRDKTVRLWRRQGNKFRLYKTLRQHSSTVWSLSFSHDGQKLASAGDDNAVNLWKIDGSLEKTFKGHSDAVVSVAFSPDSKYLASASYDKTIKLWSLEPPRLPVLRGHEDRVLSVAWSPDSTLLASGSRDHTVKLWQRENSSQGDTMRLYQTLKGHENRVASVSFSPDGEILASGSYDKTIKLWQRDGRLLKTLTGHDGSVMSVSFSPDGKLLVSSGKDKTVRIWDRQGNLLKTLTGHRGWVNSVSFSPDGQVIASASDDQTVKLWRKDGTLLRTFSPHDSWVLGVSFSPTDNLLASASWDNTVRLWRWDGTLLKTLLRGYSDSVNAVTFSPNGEILAAASFDSTVKLWSRDGKLIKTLSGHRGPVMSVSFSPDGQTLASASDDDTIILWNLNFNNLLSRGCTWVNGYIQHNRNVEQRDRYLCEDFIN